MSISAPLHSFFDVMIKNSQSGYHQLTRLMDRYLLKDILNDTMFEMFLAIRKYAYPNSIVEIKAADRGDFYQLWTKFQMPIEKLVSFDAEIDKANQMIDMTKEDIIQNRMQEFRNEQPSVLDGFKMVMAYGHSAINYSTEISGKDAIVQILMNLPKKS